MAHWMEDLSYGMMQTGDEKITPPPTLPAQTSFEQG
jgi:hypothetical protein